MFSVLTPGRSPWVVLLLQLLLSDTDVTILNFGEPVAHRGLCSGTAAASQALNSIWEPKTFPASENTDVRALSAHPRAPQGGCAGLTPKGIKSSLQTSREHSSDGNDPKIAGSKLSTHPHPSQTALSSSPSAIKPAPISGHPSHPHKHKTWIVPVPSAQLTAQSAIPGQELQLQTPKQCKEPAGSDTELPIPDPLHCEVVEKLPKTSCEVPLGARPRQLQGCNLFMEGIVASRKSIFEFRAINLPLAVQGLGKLLQLSHCLLHPQWPQSKAAAQNLQIQGK